jgi:hypothetical protein
MLAAPMIYLLYVSLGAGAMGIIVVFEALLLGLLTPQMSFWGTTRKWLVPGATALIAIGFILSAILASGLSQEHLKMNHLFYVANADSGKAAWASFDQRPDKWTSQFLTSMPQTGSLAEYAPLDINGLLKNEAQSLQLNPPSVIPLNDVTKDGIRTLRLLLTSTRKAHLISASIEPGRNVVRAQVDGKEVKVSQDQQWSIRYFGAGDEGLELMIDMRSPDPIKIRVMDVAYELPDLKGLNYSSRPENMIASPRLYSDCTLVSKSFSF